MMASLIINMGGMHGRVVKVLNSDHKSYLNLRWVCVPIPTLRVKVSTHPRQRNALNYHIIMTVLYTSPIMSGSHDIWVNNYCEDKHLISQAPVSVW